MDTNKIKSFAKEARLLLMDGVLQRLKYWGFNQDGANSESLQTTQGGFIFRGQVFTDTTVPKKWSKLKKRLNNKQDVKDVIEEAAYTWFNRLMAIKILEVNGYLPLTLEFTQEIQIPILVQNAKKGQHNLTKQADKDLLTEYLQEDKEEQAFGLLVTDLCNTNVTLHDVFGKIDDYTELLLPQNLMQPNGLLDLINGNAIRKDDFKEVELIGWLYQFYISDKKDEVFAGFKKNQKARAEDIPAATQIFTPKWIVKYMVENTVGKIYLDYEPDSNLKEDLKYLVENESDKDCKPIISDITELTLIDPACGSGHILVTGFELLFKMYREEGYTAKQAVDSILKNNIYGLDIDDRAMQLARFAVLLKAAQFDAEVLNRGIIPNIYSFPEATLTGSFKEEYYSIGQSDWCELKGMKLKQMIALNWTETVVDPKNKKEKEVAKSVVYREGTVLHTDVIDLLVQHGMESILVDYSADLENFWGTDKLGYAYSEFFYAIQLLQQGKNLGSAVKLKLSEDALKHTLQKFQEWSKQDALLQLGAFDKVFWENLKPHLEILFALTKRYASVVTNPPYMQAKNFNDFLKVYIENEYQKSKADLYSVFFEVALRLCLRNGFIAEITMGSWMFLSSFSKIRNEIIDNTSIISLIDVGWNLFDNHSYPTSVLCVNNSVGYNLSGRYYNLTKTKTDRFKEDEFWKPQNQYDINQISFKSIPSSPIAYWVSKPLLEIFEEVHPMNKEYTIREGLKTGNNSLFIKYWFELSNKCISIFGGKSYFPHTKGGGYRKWYGNNLDVLFYENNGESLRKFKGATITGAEDFFKPFVTWSRITYNNASFRYVESGFIPNMAGLPAYPLNDNNRLFLLGLGNSNVGIYILKLLNPTLNFPPGLISNLPFHLSENYNEKVIEHCIDTTKKDWDSFEISWDFKKSPLLNEQQTLNDSFKYWIKQAADDFFQLHANEEKLNCIFISIYGLQEELTPEVALRDITILQDELDRNAFDALEPVFREKGKDAIELPIDKTEILSQFVSYAIGVFLGRYRLDKPGLNIAHPNPTDEETAAYKYNGHTIKIDEDGILPLMGEDCAFPDDALVRTKDLILAIWGEHSLTDNINFLHDCLGMDLNKWLTEKFWGYHTSMYKKKPIYWLFSSDANKPQNAALKVLVYMHRMDKYTVQKIQRNYLHPHQEYIKREIGKLEENELTLSRDELKKLEKLRNWEIECRDYNEVLKELANLQIEFDLDDGVDVNYAKFEGAVAKI